MREFQASDGALARLSNASKLLYLSFIGLTLTGFATSMLLFYDSLGVSPGAAAEYYLGNAEDPAATEILLEKSYRELLEVTHFHLFTMPVILLVIGHLFLLARGGRWKVWVVVAAAALTLAHVLGPWVVRYGGPGFGFWMGATGVPFLALYGGMALWTALDLRPRSR